MSGSVLASPFPPKERNPAAEQVLGDQAQVRMDTQTPVQGRNGQARSRQVLKEYAGHLPLWRLSSTWDPEQSEEAMSLFSLIHQGAMTNSGRPHDFSHSCLVSS